MSESAMSGLIASELLKSEFPSLPGRHFISQAATEWLRSMVKPGLPRLVLFLNVVSVLPRKTRPEQSIMSGYIENCKLHDNEPDAVVEVLEEKAPDFFDGMPAKEVTLANKKAMVGKILNSHINLGVSKYGKPALRKGGDEGLLSSL